MLATQAHQEREQAQISAQQRYASWLRHQAMQVVAEVIDASLSRKALATEGEAQLVRAVGRVLRERRII